MTFEIDSINIDIDIDDIVDKVLDTISNFCYDSIYHASVCVEDIDDFIYDNEDEIDEMVSFVTSQVVTKLSTD